MNISASDNRRLGVFIFGQSVLTHWLVPLTPIGRTIYTVIVGLIQCSGQPAIEFDLQDLCDATGHGYRQVRDYLWWLCQLGLITLETRGAGNRRRLSVTLESPADPTQDTMRRLGSLLADSNMLPDRIETSSLNQMRQSIKDWKPLDISRFSVPLTLDDSDSSAAAATSAAPPQTDAPKENNRDLLKHANVKGTRLNKFKTMPRFHILAWYWWAVTNGAENTGAIVGDGLDAKKADPFGGLPDSYEQLAQWVLTAKKVHLAALEGGLSGEELPVPAGISQAMLAAAQEIFAAFGTLAVKAAPKQQESPTVVESAMVGGVYEG